MSIDDPDKAALRQTSRAPRPTAKEALLRAATLALFASMLGACSEGSPAGPATDPTYLSENLIGTPAIGSGEDSPAGWHFFADDGVEASGFLATEGGLEFLHTEIVGGSASGQARWWFEPIPLRGGSFYEYSDLSRSYGRGRLVWSCEAESERTFHSSWQSSSGSEWTRERFRFYLSEPCLVTVLHLIDQPGYLQTREHSLREVAPAPLSRAMVSIAFDDGNSSNLEIAAPELERRGWRGSFYVVLDWLGREGHLDREQVASLAARGHEIGSHSASHRSLLEVSIEELRDEVEGSLLQLEKLGARGGFAYPFGEFNELVGHYVGVQARYARTSLHGLNDAAVDPERIRIFPVTIETRPSDLRRAVADTARTGTWLVLLFHDLGPPQPDAPYRTDPAHFLDLLDALEEVDLEVLPVLDALERIRM